MNDQPGAAWVLTISTASDVTNHSIDIVDRSVLELVENDGVGNAFVLQPFRRRCMLGMFCGGVFSTITRV
jgi:hypothetical protein